mgnify:CR=1 FL=1
MTVTVDAVVYFNVVTAELALCSVDDYRWGKIKSFILFSWQVNAAKTGSFRLGLFLCKAG